MSFWNRKKPATGVVELVAGVARRLGGLGRGAADIYGLSDDLVLLNAKTTAVFTALQRDTSGMIDANHRIAAEATQGASLTQHAHRVVRGALDDALALATAVEQVEAGVAAVSHALGQVAAGAQDIDQIAFQTRIVAFNASVEAVRVGEAGRGFGVVAQSVKDLAHRVQTSSQSITRTIRELEARVRRLEEEIAGREGSAGQRRGRAVVQDAVDAFEKHFGEVAASVEATSRHASANLTVCDAMVGTLRDFEAEFLQSRKLIDGIREDTASLLELSEQTIEHLAGAGVESEDTPMIAAAERVAGEVAARFEKALAAGHISIADLFDDKYLPVQGTNPQQHLTRFVALTDELLPAIQEPVLGFSPLVAFCAAVDRNGYLPTHNRKFSLPQGTDPVKNAATSRNRRIFNDRTGLRAGRNTKRFLLQTYRRDMGGGAYVMMKDISAPIVVRGRHWGGLRIGYKFAEA